MFRLLDIAYPGRPYHRPPRVIKPVIEKMDSIKDVPADSVPAPQQVTDTITDSQAFVGNIGTGGDDNTMLIMSIVVVALALAMCLYFVYLYRKRIYRLV